MTFSGKPTSHQIVSAITKRRIASVDVIDNTARSNQRANGAEKRDAERFTRVGPLSANRGGIAASPTRQRSLSLFLQLFRHDSRRQSNCR